MTKDRSPNYPAIGLTEAIQLVRQLWTKEKRTAVAPDVVAKALGYASLSGPARSKLSALKKYGLVQDDRTGVRVSDLAMRILHPQSPDEQESATREAALSPELFRELYESHVDASDEALTSNLIRREFSPAGARLFIDAFRDTISMAKLSGSGYTFGKTTQEREAMAGTTPSISVSDSARGRDSAQVAISRPGVHVFSWPLPNNTMAEVRLTGGPITQEHLEMLRQYLELAKAAVPKTAPD